MAEIGEDQSPSPWKFKAWFRSSVKHTSVLQSLIAKELNGGINGRGFDHRMLISQQIQRSRINSEWAHATEEGDRRNSMKKIRLAQSGIKRTNHPKFKSPHFVLSTTSESRNVLGLLEHRFYWRSRRKDSHTIAVVEVQPGLDEEMKLAFCIETKTPKTIWRDAEDVNSMSKPVENLEQLKYSHQTLFVLPEIGNRLQLYNMNTGIMQEERKFGETIRISNVYVYSSQWEIILECQRKIVPGGYMDEYFIAETIPLHIVQRLQIFGPFNKPLGLKKRNWKSFDLDVDDGFLEIFDEESKHTLLYDLDEVIELNGFTKRKRSQSQVPICQIKRLPVCPLFVCPDKYFEYRKHNMHYPNHYSPFVIVPVRGNRFEVHEISIRRTLLMDSEEINDFDEDVVVRFLGCMPLQVIAKGENRIRIFQIETSEDGDHVDSGGKSASKLKLIFDRNYLNPNQAEKEPSHNQPGRERRSGLRQLPRKVYVEEDITLACAENYFLKQLVVARFCESSINCYIYDSATLCLVTTISPDHFIPSNFPTRGNNVWDNNVHVHFTNNFIAVEQKGKENTNYFVINFLRGQE